MEDIRDYFREFSRYKITFLMLHFTINKRSLFIKMGNRAAVEKGIKDCIEYIIPYLEFLEKVEDKRNLKKKNIADGLCNNYFWYLYDSINYTFRSPSQNPSQEVEDKIKLLNETINFIDTSTLSDYMHEKDERICLIDAINTLEKIKKELEFLHKNKKRNNELKTPFLRPNIYYKEKPSRKDIADYLNSVNKYHKLGASQDIKDLLAAMTKAKDDILSLISTNRI